MTKKATGKDGKPIRVGDLVQTVSIYELNKLMNRARVLRIRRQGYDGTILDLDGPADPIYPHNKTHRASYAFRVDESEKGA